MDTVALHILCREYLQLRAERLAPLVVTVEKIDVGFPAWIERFEQAVPQYIQVPGAEE